MRAGGGRQLPSVVTRIELLAQPALLGLTAAAGGPISLRIGEAVRLSLPQSLEPGASAPGRVVYAARDLAGDHYRLQFDRAAAARLMLHLNRRQELRVPPAATSPVAVELRGDAARAGAVQGVKDVSMAGIGLLVSQDVEDRLAGTWELLLGIRLPDSARMFDVATRVLYRKLLNAAIVYGLEFEKQQGEAGAEFERELFGYVMRRQRELS